MRSDTLMKTASTLAWAAARRISLLGASSCSDDMIIVLPVGFNFNPRFFIPRLRSRLQPGQP